jgi:hypothetical protein
MDLRVNYGIPQGSFLRSMLLLACGQVWRPAKMHGFVDPKRPVRDHVCMMNNAPTDADACIADVLHAVQIATTDDLRCIVAHVEPLAMIALLAARELDKRATRANFVH